MARDWSRARWILRTLVLWMIIRPRGHSRLIVCLCVCVCVRSVFVLAFVHLLALYLSIHGSGQSLILS